MKLIGMLDSPYVRRVAVSAQLMGLDLDHESVSVFRHVERFRAVNPLVKAPTLVCDDGGFLVDSSLILDFLETQVAPERRLMPVDPAARLLALRRTGIALIAMEKAVQYYYEGGLRPADKRWEDWRSRVLSQLAEAFGLLESALAARDGDWFGGAHQDAADVATAVAWRFCQFMHPGLVAPAQFPALAAHSARAEALPEFIAFPLE
ncbi:glutathione S-transferase family protein [Niveibacterium sp. SC-1]|uniref:glutathione S-transferase family protein n=1 Tax=Niveibacterium sp. SC-1 TaxID=3135646 RepID=UPI003120433B